MRFYKFRPVSDDLANDHALDALFNSYAIFSGRKNFNDLFDSKVDFIFPSPQEILALLQNPNIDPRKIGVTNSLVSNGEFTPSGDRFLNDFETGINNIIDTYAFYSLSIHNACNLLWAHYASSHTGFCIDLEFPAEQPREVIYQEEIGSIALLDLICNLSLDSGTSNLNANTELGKRIIQALLVKLKCWSYEGEYRWFASNAMGRVPKEAKFIKVKYDPRQVKVVIFGCRMSPLVKTYIRRQLPFSTEFKQAIEGKNRIEIVPFDEHAHL